MPCREVFDHTTVPLPFSGSTLQLGDPPSSETIICIVVDFSTLTHVPSRSRHRHRHLLHKLLVCSGFYSEQSRYFQHQMPPSSELSSSGLVIDVAHDRPRIAFATAHRRLNPMRTPSKWFLYSTVRRRSS